MAPKTLTEMCAAIVTAQASRQSLAPDEIADSLRRVSQTLRDIQHREHPQLPVSEAPEASIRRDHVVCLECRKTFTLLSNRHLASHGLTPREYKRKYGLRLTQPLSARVLTARRRKLARELGMGKELAAWRAANKELAS